MKYFALYLCLTMSLPVFSQDWESTYAETLYTAENSILAEKYNPQGYFPLVVLLDKRQRVLGETGYQKLSPKAYVPLLNSFIK